MAAPEFFLPEHNWVTRAYSRFKICGGQFWQGSGTEVTQWGLGRRPQNWSWRVSHKTVLILSCILL